MNIFAGKGKAASASQDMNLYFRQRHSSDINDRLQCMQMRIPSAKIHYYRPDLFIDFFLFRIPEPFSQRKIFESGKPDDIAIFFRRRFGVIDEQSAWI